MALRPLTEQQFRTRRKDRRMRWVDATVFLVGAVMIFGAFGVLAVGEEEVRPFVWRYSFVEEKSATKFCAGGDGAREGCLDFRRGGTPDEGEVVDVPFAPVDRPNVTAVRFRLAWLDAMPVTTEPECSKNDENHCDKRYEYTEESTDILRLTVFPPHGEPRTMEAANDEEDRIGEIVLRWDFLPLPEPGALEAFTLGEVRAETEERFTVAQHDALGAWRAEVVIRRAGDQNGTLPTTACPEPARPVVDGVPDSERTVCDLHTHQDTIEDNGYAAVPSAYYTASWKDKGNKWTLEMATWSYGIQLVVG